MTRHRGGGFRAIGFALVTVLAGGSTMASAVPWETTADSLSIEECVARARAHAPARVAADLDRSAAEWDSVATSKNGRPAWSVDLGGTLAPRGFYDPAITNLGEYQAKLGMAWTVSDGGRRARVRERSRLDLAAARWRSALVARETGAEAARLAFRLLRLQRARAMRSEANEWIDRISSLARSGAISGARSPADTMRIALERDAAIAALEMTRLESRIATLALLNQLGIDHDRPIAIRNPPEDDLGPIDSERMFAATEDLPQVQLERLAEALRRVDVAEAARGKAPLVELALDAGLAGADLTRAVPEDLRAAEPGANLGDRVRRDLGASAAIRIHVPLFGAAARPDLLAREADLGAARTRRAAEAMSQRRSTSVLVDQWATASRQSAAADGTSQRAERNLLKVKSLYSGGAMNLLELLDAWHTAWDARERFEDAREQERIARFLVEDRK